MKIVTDNPFIINRKKILYDQRYSMRRLAIEIGVTAQAVAQSINGKTQSLKMHRTICNKLGVSLVNFWPELYGEACRRWGTKPDPKVLAYSTTYETVRADLKELTGSA